MTSNLLTAFNDHFIDFVSDIQSVFPNDVELLTAKNSFIAVRKANPKLIVKIWKTYIADKYKAEIEAGDINFFVNKDYSQDVSKSQNSDKIMESINRIRDPIKQMSAENKAKTIKYIQNLTKLSIMCA
jgi:accessory colonization factor AcfC